MLIISAAFFPLSKFEMQLVEFFVENNLNYEIVIARSCLERSFAVMFVDKWGLLAVLMFDACEYLNVLCGDDVT